MRIKRSGVISVILVSLLAMMLVLPLPALAQPVFNTYTGTVTINGGTIDTSGPNIRVSVEGWSDPQTTTEDSGNYGMTVVGNASDIGKMLVFEVHIDGMGWVPADPICVDCEGASAQFVSTGEAQHINLVAPSGMPIITFEGAAYDISEGDSTTVNVVLSESSEDTITVDYSTVDIGDAAAGVDYNTTDGTLTFNPGQTSKSFQVNTIEDTVYEPVNEQFHLQLANASNAIIGAPNPVVVTILDDGDPPPPLPQVYFAGTSFQGNEGTNVMVEVVLSEESEETVTVDYATQQRTGMGAATAGVDYTNANGTLTFLPGDTSKTFQVTLINDGVFEGPEKLDVVLDNPNEEAILGSPSTAVVQINNVNPPDVEWWCHADRVALIAPYPANDRAMLGAPVNLDDIVYEGDWFQVLKYDEMGTVGGCEWQTYVRADGFLNDGPCALTQLVPGEYYYVVVSDETKPLQW